jgi:hypothetical protein
MQRLHQRILGAIYMISKEEAEEIKLRHRIENENAQMMRPTDLMERVAKEISNPPDPTNEESRITNRDTGGEKGQKVFRFDLIPWVPMYEVAKLYGKGAEKYSERNWEKGYDWSLSYAAAMRHITQFWNGESHDEETGCHHLSSVIFHCLAMMEFERTHPELDNRPKDQ